MLESLESRRLLASDIVIDSPSDLSAYIDADTGSIVIGDDNTSSITIADDILIDAGSPSGESGNITLTAKSIELGARVQVLANGQNDSLDGAIKFESENVMSGFNISAVNQIEDIVRHFKNQDSVISIGEGVVIEGGKVDITTNAGNEMKDEWVSSLILKQVMPVVLEALHLPDIGTLPISVQAWTPESSITLGSNVEIDSADLKISSDASANAIGKAVWNSLSSNKVANSPYGVAIGEFYNDASATITIGMGSTITAAGEVEVTTQVKNKTELEAQAIKNLGIATTNPEAISIAWGSAQVKSTSVITLESDTTIHAEEQVVIEAEAEDENAVASKAVAYRDGLATAGGAFTYSEAEVQVIANGTIISGFAPEPTADHEPLLFNPAFVVDFPNASLQFDEVVPYTTGQKVVFDSSDGSTIPGLVPGNIYYAIVNPSEPNHLKLASTADNALSENAISFGSGYPTITTQDGKDIPITVVDSYISNAILFSFENTPEDTPLFVDGETVTYTPQSGQFIGVSDETGHLLGPLSGGTYNVKVVPSPEPFLFPFAIQLLNPETNSAVVLNTNSYFTASDGSSQYQVASVDTLDSQVDFNFPTPPEPDEGEPTPLPVPVQNVTWTNGQEIVFTSGLGNQFTSLVNGKSYYAIVDPSTPGVIRLADSLLQSEVANPAVQSAIPQLQTVELQPAIAGTENNFLDQAMTSILVEQADHSYHLENDASGGTFQLTLDGPEGTVTTESLAYNITAEDLEDALNSLDGILATVNSSGDQAWEIAILFRFEIGNVELDSDLVFSHDPRLADGSAVVYLGIDEKPIGNLTPGETYFVYQTQNTYFNADFPQYMLNLRATADMTAPLVVFDLEQSMTDTAGLSYPVASTDLLGSQLAVPLPAEVSIDAGNSASTSEVGTGSASFFTLADAGNFTLIVTSGDGTVQTTNTLNVPTDASTIEQHLNSLPGVNVTVTGEGTLLSPWTVVGLVDQTLGDDSSQLTNDGFASRILFTDVGQNVQQVWTETPSAGNDVTLTFTVEGQAPSAVSFSSISTAGEVAAEIQSIPNLRATVTGAGTASDPWQITSWYQSIQTGDELQFHDRWNAYNLGMLHGSSYFAVPAEDQAFPNLLILSFASSKENALANVADINFQDYLLFDQDSVGIMAGALMGVDDVPEEDTGIEITASLDANDSARISSGVGSIPMLGYYVNGAKSGHTEEGAEGGGKYLSNVAKEIEEKLPHETWELIEDEWKLISDGDNTSPIEVSLAMALLISESTTQVTIGSEANLQTSGKVKIDSEISHVLHTFAAASIARTTGVEKSKIGNSSIAVPLALTFVDNTNQTIIQPNARISGAMGVAIESNVEYPFAWKETKIAKLRAGGLTKNKEAADSVAAAENIIKTSLFSNAFGVSKWLFNHSVNSAIRETSPEAAIKNALSGSVIYTQISTDNLAQICDGAQINQNEQFPADEEMQGVDLSAETITDQVSGAGQLAFHLNFGWIYHASRSKKPSQVQNVNTSENLIGGSFNITRLDTTTEAILGGTDAQSIATLPPAIPNDSTRVGFTSEGLNIAGTTETEFVSIAQSGGKDSGFGLQASITRVDVDEQTTTAAILAAAQYAPLIDAYEGSAGKVSVVAADDTILTPSSGGILVGKSINLGFSSSELILNRDVNAYIGETISDAGTTPDQTTWPSINTAGDITVESEASGKLIPVSIAGSFISKTSKEPGQEIERGDEKFRFGLGVSGDYSVADITDNINSYLNGAIIAGELSAEQNVTQTFDIQASNDTRLNVATGAAAFQREKGKGSSLGLAGSASNVVYTSNVMANVEHATITAFEISAAAKNEKTVGAFSAGLSGTSAAGVGVAVAGSFSFINLTNRTIAELKHLQSNQQGSLSVTATETDDIWSAAGVGTFITSLGGTADEFAPGQWSTKFGVGLGIAENQLHSTTHANILNSIIDQIVGNLELKAEQASSSFVLAAGLIADIAKGSSVAAYGMGATNRYETADVSATVRDSDINSQSASTDSGFDISALMIPIMITTAGDLGLSISWKKSEGVDANVGAGAAVTVVSVAGQAMASIRDSEIHLEQGDLSVEAFTGKPDDFTDLDATMSSLNLPLGQYNLFSLSIAGGISSAVTPLGQVALGVDGVGAGIGADLSIQTIAEVIDSRITLIGAGSSSADLNVKATEDLSVYNDAGGATLDLQLGGSASVGIVAGIGAGKFNSEDTVSTSIERSIVEIAGSLEVQAISSTSVLTIGFGVAIDLSIADGGVGVGIAASNAEAINRSANVINASIGGGTLTVGDSSSDSINVSATDQLQMDANGGSGSLSIALGSDAGVALAAGATVTRSDTSNQVTAVIGSQDSTNTSVTASGPVSVTSNNRQMLSSNAIAVASSVAVGGGAGVGIAAAGAGSRIESNNQIFAGLLAGTSLDSTLQHSLSSETNTALTVSAMDDATLSSIVGSGALSVAIGLSGAMFGASLGISISEVTNNNEVKAVVSGSNTTVTTTGTDVIVESTGSNDHFSQSVATSASLSLISVAGAGGNSNIYDNATFDARVDTGATIVTGDDLSDYGSLSVTASSEEQIDAEIFAGVLGVGSIGVFDSNAERHGATNATVSTDGELKVGDLTVEATTNQSVTSEGWSVTIGILAGTGENHNLVVDEQVTVEVGSTSGVSWDVHGDLTANAHGEHDAIAQTSGAGGGNQDISVSGIGVGFFKVDSTVSPVVELEVDNLALNVSGTSLFSATTLLENHGVAISGSGSLVGADAATGKTISSPTITLTTSDLILNAEKATIEIDNGTTYTNNANSIFATLAGGSVARAENTTIPELTLTLGEGTSITANGSVIVSSDNSVIGYGNGESNNSDGLMARVGGGGLLGEFGGSSNSNANMSSSIELAESVEIRADEGDILIAAGTEWITNQLTHLGTGSLLPGSVSILSTIESDVHTEISLDDNVSLTADQGRIGIGTDNQSVTSADSDSYTFGLASGVSGNASNEATSYQSVSVGNGAEIRASKDVTVTAGFNPLTSQGTQQDVYATVSSRAVGLLIVPSNLWKATLDATTEVTIDTNAQVTSDRDVTIGAIDGINNAVAYSFASTDGASGRTKIDSDGLTESNTATINGSVIAGNSSQLSIVLNESGDNFTVNNGTTQTFSNANDPNPAIIQPEKGESFIPFQIEYLEDYDPTQLLQGLDPAVELVLRPSLSTETVPAFSLSDLTALGGRVVIQADELLGSGSVHAHSPEIEIKNLSTNYLLLDRVNVPQTYGMGDIDLSVNQSLGDVQLVPDHRDPTIAIDLTADGPVGNKPAGPALVLTGNMNNTGGTVNISNLHGALVQEGAITAESVKIDVPNASFIVNTPDDYFGTAGDAASYWTSNSNLLIDGNFESPQWKQVAGDYQYRPTIFDWEFQGNAGISGNNSGFTSGNPAAPYGSQVAFIQETGAISRQIPGLIAGSSYVLQFYGAQRGNNGAQTQEIEIKLGDESLRMIKPEGTAYSQFTVPFTAPVPELNPVTDPTTITLTDATTNRASAVWNPQLLAIPSSGEMTLEFTYQASGDRAADGVTLAFQTQGVNALGGSGGQLGYVGIPGPTAAYQINIFDAHTKGSNFVITNTSKDYHLTDPVDFSSGHKIDVKLVYDAGSHTITESLTDRSSGVTYHKTYEVDLFEALGETTYLGFTGGDGAATSIQTITDFSLTTSAGANQSGFEGWNYVSPRTLTFTGLDPDGSDSTVFLDGITLSPNPAGFTPGLNWYSPYLADPTGAYSANIAATHAANALFPYIDAQKSSHQFSSALYNTGNQSINVNNNVNTGNVGGAYPSGPKKNYDSKQHGSGIILFGSEIPYLWAGAGSPEITNSELLTSNGGASDLGYLDTLSNSQKYSKAASGNPNDASLNVTQGTGPQNNNNSAERGVFPVIPHNGTYNEYPNTISVPSPGERVYGGSITTGEIAVTARYIDINGPLSVGVINKSTAVSLGDDLQSAIDQYQAEYASNQTTNTEFNIDSFLGDEGLTGYYDAQQKKLFIDPYSINAGVVTSVFQGGILSTSTAGKISVHSNPKTFDFLNQTDVPLVLNSISSIATVPTGIVQFDDTITETSTVYIYSAGDEGIEIYKGDLGDSLEEMLQTTSEGKEISHTLSTDLTYQWTEEASIARDLKFTRSDNNYTLTTTNDDWYWKNANGSTDPQYGTAINPFRPSASSEVLPERIVLSQGAYATASSYWSESPIDLPEDGNFTVEFTYQASGDKSADGITLAFQNEGVDAIGDEGAYLGYVGIDAPKAAYQINIYDALTQGSNFVTDNTSQSYQSTAPEIDFASGNAVDVKLEFIGGATPKLIETLAYSGSETGYSSTYEGIDLTDLLGTTAYIGFTGGTGGAKSIQTVSNFSMTGTSLASALPNSPHDSGHVVRENSTEYTQVLSAAITELETAKTVFANDKKDAWNYGPNTEWSWAYPTEILMRLRNRLPANNPIAIDFSDVVFGSMSLASDKSSLQFKGGVKFPGSIEISAAGGISQSPGSVISGQSIEIETTQGGIGFDLQPLTLDVQSDSPIQATAVDGINLASTADMNLGRIQASGGPVTLESGGDIIDAGTEMNPTVEGANIDLLARNGVIGSQENPLSIQTETSQLETGTIVDGLLTAHADSAVFVMQTEGDLRVLSVSTADPVGIVSITNSNGEITNGGIADAYNLNGLSLKAVNHVVQKLNSQLSDDAERTVSAFDNSIEVNYQLYWNLLNYSGATTTTPNPDTTCRSAEAPYTLTEDGTLYYQNQANAYYNLPAFDGFEGWNVVGSQSSPTKQFVFESSSTETASAVWNPEQIQIPASGNFEVAFTYQLTGDGNNHGITLAFQSSGNNALGGAEGDLGYVGIPGLTAAYQINVEQSSDAILGTNFVTSNTAGDYSPTGSVNFTDRNPVQVNLVYDADAGTVVETLFDTVTRATFSRTYSDIDLAAALGTNAYLGFTGTNGQNDSTQTISGFSLVQNASAAEVQSYADLLYDNSVNAFESNLAFGMDWESGQQFDCYQPDFEFQISNDAISQLSYGEESLLNTLALVSLEALSPSGGRITHSATSPVIQTSLLYMNSGGSIGKVTESVEISLPNLQSGNLTPYEQSLLSSASAAGEVQFIGVNAAGETITYSYGEQPSGVTPTGVIVKIEQPLFVDLASDGLAMMSAADGVNVAEIEGDLNLLYLTAGGTDPASGSNPSKPVILEANASIVQNVLQPSTATPGWSTDSDGKLVYTDATSIQPTDFVLPNPSLTGVYAGFLSLIAGDSVGSPDLPLEFSATDPVDLFSLKNVYLRTENPVQMRQWSVLGDLELQVAAAEDVTDALADRRTSFAGFDNGGTEWSTTTANPSDAQVTTNANGVDKLVLTTNAAPAGEATTIGYSNTVYAKNQPVVLSSEVIFGFVYQSSGSAARVALNLGNTGETGLALVLNQGDPDGSGAWADFLESDKIASATSGQTLGSVNLNSNHPIQVVWTYNELTQSSKATLTDTITGDAATITLKQVSLIQALGGHSASIAWQALSDGSTTVDQSISAFRLIDGAVNLTAASVDVQSDGSFGIEQANLSGFQDWVATNATSSATADTLTLTANLGNEANAFWYPEPIRIPKKGSFVAEFSYQASGDQSADGITFAMQTQGVDAVGGIGGSLGYAGITSPAAAYQINIYVPNTKGSNFVTTNTSGHYQSNGPVDFSSGNKINVKLTYDANLHTVTETLTDTMTGSTYESTYENVNLTEVLGATSYIGFTGGDGGLTSTQTVTDFSITSTGAVAGPILTAIINEANIDVGGMIVLEQVIGDLTVGQIASPSLIDVTAPFGNVSSAESTEANNQLQQTEPPLAKLTAPRVVINSTHGIGTTDLPIQVSTQHLSAASVFGDVVLSHLDASGGTKLTTHRLIAGETISLINDGNLDVTGTVVGKSVDLSTTDLPTSGMNDSIYLAVPKMTHINGDVLLVSIRGFASLQLDDSTSPDVNDITISQGQIKFDTLQLMLDDIPELAFSLGSGVNTLSVQDASDLLSLRVESGSGDDQLTVQRDAMQIPFIELLGSTDIDTLALSLMDVGGFVTRQEIVTPFGIIQHKNIEHLILNSGTAFNDNTDSNQIILDQSDYADNLLLALGTNHSDSFAMNMNDEIFQVAALWGNSPRITHSYALSDIQQLRLETLAGDDIISILGSERLSLEIKSGQDDDWIMIDGLSAKITDLDGDNYIITDSGDDTIHTGVGNDVVDAGNGTNEIRDEGGTNSLKTGDQNDTIYHANADDFILAGTGINDIWLNDVHQGWHNSAQPADVNRDKIVTALDALLIMNRLNDGVVTLLGSADSENWLYDVSDDGFITPLDALRVSNEMNREYAAESEAFPSADTSRRSIPTQQSDSVFSQWDAGSNDATTESHEMPTLKLNGHKIATFDEAKSESLAEIKQLNEQLFASGQDPEASEPPTDQLVSRLKRLTTYLRNLTLTAR